MNKAMVGSIKRIKEGACSDVVAAAKRDLAVKVLAAVRNYQPTTGNGRIAHSKIYAELTSLFASEHIDVKRSEDETRRT